MIRLASIRPSALSIPFKAAFRHASAERSRMESLWIDVRSEGGVTGIGEGCPRAYVTGESIASALAFCKSHMADWAARIVDVDSLTEWVHAHADDIDRHPAAWCAVELACLDCLGKTSGASIEQLLALPPLDGTYRYSAVLGDAPPDAFRRQLRAYLDRGFADVKIKLSGNLDLDRDKVAALAEMGVAAARVRADANNVYADVAAAMAHLSILGAAFNAIEEPLRANDRVGLQALADRLGRAIILDESALRLDHLDGLQATAGSWIVNVRVSKMGGLLRSAAVVRRAREIGVRIVVGAHVGETSVLTRAGLTLAGLAGSSLVAQEGAFGTHLLAHDPVTPCLMFGAAGVLQADRAGLLPHGLGLTAAG